MQFSTTVFVVVMVLGVTQLALWVIVGLCLGTRGLKSTPEESANVRRLRDFAEQLGRLVSGVVQDVDQHRMRIKQVSRKLASSPQEGEGHLTEFVLKTVAQIVQINERLQARLYTAEERLQLQTRQVESGLVEARTDPLTALPNRRAFDDEMVRRLAEWQRKKNTFCLIMVDIDHFKELNDRHGHPAGDLVLRGVAEVLERTLREMDMVARVGGEEFAIMLPSTTLHDAQRAVERIRTAVATEEFFAEETQLHLTVSLGLATVETGDDSISVVKRADEALYHAKDAGRNCGFLHNGRSCRMIDLSHRETDQTDDLPDSDAARPLAEVTEEP